MKQARLFFSLFLLCSTAFLSACYVKQLPKAQPSPYAIAATPHPYSAPQGSQTSSVVPALSSRPQHVPHTSRHFTQEVKVGLLLPLSGKDALLGKLLLDAATLGLEDAYSNPTMRSLATKITLLPHDTGESPTKAKKAASEAIASGAKLLIGPLYADATQAIAPIARKAQIPVLSFSNSPDSAREGVHLFGYMVQQQAAYITTYAVRQQKQHLAVLLPTNAYGTLIEDAVQDAALKTGLAHVTIVKYEAGSTDMPLIAAQLSNVLHQKSQMTTTPAADSVLLVESGTRLEALLKALATANIAPPDVSYLGIGTWLNEELLGNRRLMGAEFASTSLSSHYYFNGRMQYSYNITPPHIAALAYDAPQLLAMVLMQEGQLSESALTRSQGYQLPATGLTRLNHDGTNTRALGVVRLSESAFVESRPAPRYIEE
jgi:branched-chain amino acid transport system substrate-binding protein